MKALASVALFVITAAVGSAQDGVDYDSYAALDSTEQAVAYDAMTPEARAALQRTHVERWLATNRERLSPEQIAAVEETLDWMGPRLYDEANRQTAQMEVIDRVGELQKVLSLLDLGRAFGTPGAPGNYIPPPTEG